MITKKRQSDPRLDDGSTDSADEKGPLKSPINAAHGCQHVKRAVDTAKLRKELKAKGLVVECAMCAKTPASPAAEALENTSEDAAANCFEYDNTLWLCLRCGTQLCGRSKNQHALKHFKTPHSDLHALTMNTRSYEIWCYECDNEVSVNSTKNLLECMEIVKKFAQKPPLNNLENKIIETFQNLRPLVNATENLPAASDTVKKSTIPLPPPVPGMAKRITAEDFPALYGDKKASTSNAVLSKTLCKNEALNSLPRVRGLTNLGNTCFFNAVLQCLAQTPYLLEVLKESAEPGEEFILPGGTFNKFEDNVDIELPPIKGTLLSWGGLTNALANALEELQSGGAVFNPSRLFEKLCTKCPQFRGGDQHDSHELLRHLLESVRSEDLKRYQRVILQNLGINQQDVKDVPDEMRQKCKIYGNQAADRILRPDQVFRGFLVSTLTCQDCYNVSSRHEYFLDLSLPVSVEKPQPPQRRRTSPDNEPINSFYLNPAPVGPTKSQIKKEKEKERKAKRAAKHQNNKKAQKQLAIGENTTDITNGTAAGNNIASLNNSEWPHENANRGGEDGWSMSSSTSEQSDADVEDNLDDVAADKVSAKVLTNSNVKTTFDTNGNNQVLQSPADPEKRDDSPENIDKDSLDEDENDSGIATSPANAGGESFPPSSDTNGGGPSSDNCNDTLVALQTTINNRLVEVGLSGKGAANIVRQLTLSGSECGGDNTVETNGEPKEDSAAATATIEVRFDKLQLGGGNDQMKAARRMRAKRVRTQSYSDWSTTIGPRYHCEDGECSVQSCLNNFTAVELMSGNNKVGCENCTKRFNGNGNEPDAKTIYTDATKQFLISSPPAVLILHLKRFQLGPRCIFRKLTRAVDFPMVLDIAPFCGSKVKNLPNIDRKQKKLLYALYGVVEHSGGMYGGHYTAFVKVRAKLDEKDKRWKFIPQGSKAELDQDDEQRKKLDELLAKEKARELRMKAADDSDDFTTSSSSASSSPSSSSSSSEHEETSNDNTADEASNVKAPAGKWYYVSDSRVQEASEDEVLRSQAYLLFYERIY